MLEKGDTINEPDNESGGVANYTFGKETF